MTPFELKVQRYEDLTAAEQAGMEAFVRLFRDGDQHEATAANNAALDLEHFISVLDLDPDKFSLEEVKELVELRDRAAFLTDRKILLHALHEL